jgi:hypothetical protein
MIGVKSLKAPDISTEFSIGGKLLGELLTQKSRKLHKRFFISLSDPRLVGSGKTAQIIS